MSSKVVAATAAEICANFDLSKEAKKLLRDGMNPQEFAAALINDKKYLDAIEFVAYALPAREGIWWGCLCMQQALGDNLSAPERAAATAAVQWVMQPSEENRVAAKAPSDIAGPGTLPGGLALAVFHTGGNINPPNAPPKEPAPFAPAKAVARVIKLATTKTEPIQIVKMQKAYAELGLGVAEGRYI